MVEIMYYSFLYIFILYFTICKREDVDDLNDTYQGEDVDDHV